MRLTRIISALAVAGAMATPAFAEETDQGFYAVIGLSATTSGLGHEFRSSTVDTTFTHTHTTSTRQEGAGIQGGIGYRFNKNSAIEVIALRLPDTQQTTTFTQTDLTTGTVFTSTNTSDITNTGLAVTWLYGVPVNQWVNPYARAGVTLNYAKSRDTGSGGGSTTTGSGSGFNTGYLIGLGELCPKVGDGVIRRRFEFV